MKGRRFKISGDEVLRYYNLLKCFGVVIYPARYGNDLEIRIEGGDIITIGDAEIRFDVCEDGEVMKIFGGLPPFMYDKVIPFDGSAAIIYIYARTYDLVLRTKSRKVMWGYLGNNIFITDGDGVVEFYFKRSALVLDDIRRRPDLYVNGQKIEYGNKGYFTRLKNSNVIEIREKC